MIANINLYLALLKYLSTLGWYLFLSLKKFEAYDYMKKIYIIVLKFYWYTYIYI